MISKTEDSSLQDIVCRRIPRNLILSGKMDDPLWQQAEPQVLMDAVSGTKENFTTEVRVLYSGEYLYVGFYCEDDHVWGTLRDRDDPVYREECVEVFVCPSGKTHQYYEINISPKNVLFDACILNGRTADNPRNKFQGFHDFNLQDIQTRAHVEGILDVPGEAGSWKAEYAIPLEGLWGAPHIPPEHGDVWRVNFYRIDSPDRVRVDYYSWSTVHEANFHQPWKFGRIRFLIEEDP